jgi:hypothetical protein
MRAQITKDGLLVPRELLGEMDEGEVEILKESGGRLLILPGNGSRIGLRPTGEDPILSLGEDPVDDEVTDASVNHDRYLYGA